MLLLGRSVPASPVVVVASPAIVAASPVPASVGASSVGVLVELSEGVLVVVGDRGWHGVTGTSIGLCVALGRRWMLMRVVRIRWIVTRIACVLALRRSGISIEVHLDISLCYDGRLALGWFRPTDAGSVITDDLLLLLGDELLRV